MVAVRYHKDEMWEKSRLRWNTRQGDMMIMARTDAARAAY